MCRDERQANRLATKRHRNARCRWHRDASGDARDSFARDPGFFERQSLFATAGEHERIAPLEPNHAFPFARQSDQECLDFRLRYRMMPGLLAHRKQLDVIR